MRALLATYSWQELRHHPWRTATSVVAVMLGVALAFSVHLINASALDEFSDAARSASGQPDAELRGLSGSLPEEVYAQIATDPRVAIASPVLELQTVALAADGARRTVRVLGIDPLVAWALAPAVTPVIASGADRLAILAPDSVFLNPAAQQLLPRDTVQLQAGLRMQALRVAGTVSAGGGPLAVMDIAAAQDAFHRTGELTRIDVRLAPGVSAQDWIPSVRLPAGVRAATPADAGERVDQLSRAYRVNLTVLSLVALFTGSFLVFSVLALSVARRAQQFALLGVLGLTARERLTLVLAESACIGAVGSAVGIALGAALASGVLALVGGDLGGGYFRGGSPHLQWSTLAALVYFALGIAAALAGGWLPARQAAALPLATTLKGLGAALPLPRGHRMGLVLIAAGMLCALLPPVAGLPLAAYASVGLLLVGGIAVLPSAVGAVYDRLAPLVAAHALPLLAVERARRGRENAAVAISGVVAALSLAVALTVMVASFRHSVSAWLDVLLPADLYLQTANTTAAGDSAFLTPAFVQEAARVDGVSRLATQRLRSLPLDAARPAVALLARPVGDASRSLPLVGEALPVPAGHVGIYVSEAMPELYGARRGEVWAGLDGVLGPGPYFVAGIWRDYVRQTGAIVIELRDYQRLTSDARVNDMQIWMAPGADAAQVQARLRALAERTAGQAGLIELASAAEVRAVSLRIFDRSFAVTYWLQAVAIGIGLFGVAASFSAQVLARRKEFGLLSHLGLTRRQILGVVAAEGAAWTAVGAAAGLALGLAVAMVLVHVVNPQSFRWTMDLLVPWLRLVALCAAVVAAGTLTAWVAGRAAAGRDAVLAVKEDW
jgi:putative ABC transport system permease protein